MFIADLYNNRIRKVDASGNLISTIAGGGSYIPGDTAIGDGGLAINAWTSPVSIAFSPNGDIYFADFMVSGIRKIDIKTGNISTFSGSKGPLVFRDPIGNMTYDLIKYDTWLMGSIFIDSISNVYFADSTSIFRIDSKTNIVSSFFIEGNSNNNVTGLTADRSGNFYFYDGAQIKEYVHDPICDNFHIKSNYVFGPTLSDSCNGRMSFSALGGNSPYNFNVNYAYGRSNSALSPINNPVASFSKLCPAWYYVVLNDSNGCVADTGITLLPIYNCVNSNLKVGVSGYKVPSGDSCNGSLLATATGGKAPYRYHWSDSIIGPADTTLCLQKVYKVYAVDSIGCIASTLFLAGKDSVMLPCSGFSTSINAPTKLATCSGTASANVIGGTAPYVYSWNNYYNTASISSICPGMYTVQVYDKNGCYATASANIQADTNVAPTPVSVYVNTSYAINSYTCNGVAVASATGGVAPYKFSFSNRTSYLNYDSLLCSGVYQVTVTDKNLTHASMTFVISNPMNTFGDSVTQIRDSFAISTPNTSAPSICTVNYPKVDSVRILSYKMVGGSRDSVLVTWAVYSANTSTSVGVIYLVGASGYYDFTLMIYCGPTIASKMNGNVVNGYLTAHEKYYINTSATGIAIIGSAGNASSIYPVPFNSTLTVRFGTTDKFTVSIMDVTGKMVIDPILNYTNPECTINLSHLQAGIYFVKVQSSKGGVEFFKVIKD